jgi:starch phosphorylase
MIEEYMEDYYVQAGLAHQILGENRQARARELRDWKLRIRSLWNDIKILDVSLPKGDHVSLGEVLEVTTYVRLGHISAEEVVVDLCHGIAAVDSDKLINRNVTAMVQSEESSDGVYCFKGTIPCEETGVYAYRIRVLPFHPYLFNQLSMNLITWG